MKKWILILSIIASYNTYAAVHCPEGTTLDVDCWQCGDDCTAYLSDDNINNGKTLNIKGSGTMTNWVCDEGIWPSWYAKSDEITSAVIEGKSENSTGITSIGAWTFMNMTNLKSVDIPDSVTTIEGSAFKGTASLETIEIPSSVTDIGTETFYTSGIKSIVIPDSVTTIGVNAFRHAENLTSIVISDSLLDADGNILEYAQRDGVYTGISPDAFKYGALNTIYCPTDKKCGNSFTGLSGTPRIISYSIDENGQIKAGGKTYASLDDLASGNHIVKRIYTIDEANEVAGKVNSVKIRYR